MLAHSVDPDRLSKALRWVFVTGLLVLYGIVYTTKGNGGWRGWTFTLLALVLVGLPFVRRRATAKTTCRSCGGRFGDANLGEFYSCTTCRDYYCAECLAKTMKGHIACPGCEPPQCA